MCNSTTPTITSTQPLINPHLHERVEEGQGVEQPPELSGLGGTRVQGLQKGRELHVGSQLCVSCIRKQPTEFKQRPWHSAHHWNAEKSRKCRLDLIACLINLPTSWLKSLYVRPRFALTPRGGSLVSLTPFCRTA